MFGFGVRVRPNPNLANCESSASTRTRKIDFSPSLYYTEYSIFHTYSSQIKSRKRSSMIVFNSCLHEYHDSHPHRVAQMGNRYRNCGAGGDHCTLHCRCCGTALRAIASGSDASTSSHTRTSGSRGPMTYPDPHSHPIRLRIREPNWSPAPTSRSPASTITHRSARVANGSNHWANSTLQPSGVGRGARPELRWNAPIQPPKRPGTGRSKGGSGKGLGRRDRNDAALPPVIN